MRETRTGLAFEPLALFAVAGARLGLDDLAGAHATAAEGVAVAAKRGMRLQEASCRWMLGRVHLLQGCQENARAELEHALELAGEDGLAGIPHVLVAFADLAALEGDNEGRLRELEQAHRLFEQQGATGHACRVAAEIATAAA
jgi:hypothetical protein